LCERKKNIIDRTKTIEENLPDVSYTSFKTYFLRKIGNKIIIITIIIITPRRQKRPSYS